MRKYQNIIGYDYRSKKEFDNHKAKMEKNGWVLCDGMFGGALDSYEWCEEDQKTSDYKYSANYVKSPFM